MKDYTRLVAYYTACVATFLALEYGFTARVGLSSTPVHDLTIYGADSLLLMSPMWVCGPRWRRMGWILTLAVGLFLYANTLYFRYWQGFIPIDAILSASSYNGFVFNSVLRLMHISDLPYLLTACLPLAVWRWLKVISVRRLPARMGACGLAASAAIYSVGVWLSAWSEKRYWDANGMPGTTIGARMHDKLFLNGSSTMAWRCNGMTIYMFNRLYNMIVGASAQMPITNLQKNHLQTFIDENRTALLPDTVFEANLGKNLILIIVESLNASVINRTANGHEITPVMNALANGADTVLSCLTLIPQINEGGSADGQMIYNTGLLPISSGVAANSYAGHDYPSLARALGYDDAVEIICENGEVWNHRATNLAYGYTRLYEQRDLREAGIGISRGQDAALFEMAWRVMPTLRRPFMMELTTISMHFPFDEQGMQVPAWLEKIPGESDLETKYLQTAHYFDTELGRFIEGLKTRGVYRESVIVIASDHHYSTAEATNDRTDMSVTPIVLIIANAGIGGRVNRPVGQIDVYPTLLEIMGRGRSYGWPGVGTSILDTLNMSAVDRTGHLHGSSGRERDRRRHRAWGLSDSIIRSNYFAL